jgi:hypothetical protein
LRHNSTYEPNSDEFEKHSPVKRKTTKQRIREEVQADRARYDEVTRRLQETIERYRRRAEQRSES